MTKVLLTGATGFLGRHVLAALLDAGHEVHAVSRSRPDHAASTLAAHAEGDGTERRVATWHAADLASPGGADGLLARVAPEALVHMAWYVEHGRYWHARENVLWTEATLRLLREFVDAGGRRAVLAGTCAEYEWSPSNGPYDERRSPLNPATMYGIAKDATRRVAERLAADAGIELAWARVFMPYGPDEPSERLLASVIAALLAGTPAPVSSGEQIRDFMYVADLGRAFAALLDSPVQGPVNVASGRGASVRELVELAAGEVGRPELIRWGSVPSREGDPAELVADVTRLRTEVGFAPSVGLGEGVRRTVSWWRERAAR